MLLVDLVFHSLADFDFFVVADPFSVLYTIVLASVLWSRASLRLCDCSPFYLRLFTTDNLSLASILVVLGASWPDSPGNPTLCASLEHIHVAVMIFAAAVFFYSHLRQPHYPCDLFVYLLAISLGPSPPGILYLRLMA